MDECRIVKLLSKVWNYWSEDEQDEISKFMAGERKGKNIIFKTLMNELIKNQ